MKFDSQFQKNFIWNLIGTTVNAFTSLFYMIIVTRVNGLEEAGIFTFAFSNACVLVVIGMYMGRTYQISDARHTSIEFIVTRIFTCFMMLIVLGIMIAFHDYSKVQIILLFLWTFFKMLEAFSDVLYGIMQKAERLDYVGKSMTLKAISSVLIFILLDICTKSVVVATTGVVLINGILLLCVDFFCYRKVSIQKCSFQKMNCIYLLRDGFYVFGTTLLSNYLVNASKYTISSSGTNTEQAVFGIIVMPATVMILAGQYLIQPFLVKMAELYGKKEAKVLSGIIWKMVFVLVGIGSIGVIAAGLVGIPFLEFIYGTELSTYRDSLIIIIIGATCYGVVTVFISLLTIMHKNRTQFVCLVMISAIIMLIAPFFIQKEGVLGASFIYLISMVFACGIMGGVVYRNIHHMKNA